MAPRKAAKSSSSSRSPLPSAAAEKVNAVSHIESPAARKKSKATAPPPLPAAASPPAPTTVYVLMKSRGQVPHGFDNDWGRTYSAKEVYYSEDQAYASAIRNLISGYETQGVEWELREIATTKGLPLKERMKKLRLAAIRSLREADDAEVRNLATRFRVKKIQLFPVENVDDSRLLDGITPNPSDDSDYAAASLSSKDSWDEADNLRDTSASSSSSDGLDDDDDDVDEDDDDGLDDDFLFG